MNLILASTSIYRKELLQQLRYEFSTQASRVDEDIYKTQNLSPEDLVSQLAEAKAEAVFLKNPESIVIGGDQAPEVDGEILSKPGDRENSIKILKRLAGRTHRLLTATCIMGPQTHLVDLNITNLTMKKLTSAEIESYVDLDEPYYCAGAYMYEKNGHQLFEKVECTDKTAITGLPLRWLDTQLSYLSAN